MKDANNSNNSSPIQSNLFSEILFLASFNIMLITFKNLLKKVLVKLHESNKVATTMIFGSIVIQNFFSHTDFPQGNEEQKRSFS